MAKNKRTQSRERRTRQFPSFAQVKGKIVEGVEVSSTDDGCVIGIIFQDRTYLSFDVRASVTVLPELSDWKTEEYRSLKRWQIINC